MWVSKIEQRYVKAVANRIHQGDILTDLSFYFATTDYQADPTSIRYAVVMSQDCDLEQDYFSREKAKTPPAHSSNQAAAKHDKYLPTVLVCPAYSFESFTQGQHLNDWQMRKFVSKDDLSDLKRIKKNDQFKRYHYFESDDILKVP